MASSAIAEFTAWTCSGGTDGDQRLDFGDGIELGTALACTSSMQSSSLVRRASSHYIGYALATAPSVIVMFALIFGGIAGVVGISAALFGGAALIGTALVATRCRCVRDYLDREADLRARAYRESVREVAIRRAGPVRTAQYGVLRRLVENSNRHEPNELRRVDLEELLDYFVRLATNLERALEAFGRRRRTSPRISRPRARRPFVSGGPPRSMLAARRIVTGARASSGESPMRLEQ